MNIRFSNKLSILFLLAIVACALIEETIAGKNKGGDDIILYNGNIILRNHGKKGKGGSSIVVANSANSGGVDMMPFYDWGGFGRRR